MGPDWSPFPLPPDPAAGSFALPPAPARASRPASGTGEIASTPAPLSPTGTLRARQRLDSTQQAVSELNILNEQIIALPERLRESGLARSQQQNLRETNEAFAELAQLAWQNLAEDCLDQTVTTPAYRQLVVATSRRVNRLQQEAATAQTAFPESTEAAKPSPRTGALWVARTRMVTHALIHWREGLRASSGAPNVFVLGEALEDLQAAIGVAGFSTASLLLQRLLLSLSLVVGGLIALIYTAASASALTLGITSAATTLTTVAALAILLFCGGLWLLGLASRSLWRMAGITRWRLVERDATVSQLLLTLWRWLCSLGGLGGLAFLTWRAITVHTFTTLSAARDLHTAVVALTGSPLPLLAAALGVVYLTPVLALLPATLVYQLLLAGELAGHSARLPAARNVALQPALQAGIIHTFLILAVVTDLIVHLQTAPLLRYAYLRVSWVSVAATLVLLTLFVAGVDAPYRLGIARWRRGRLEQLATQKREVTMRLDRLGAFPGAIEDVANAQYDVARLQYLQLQENDARREPGSAFGTWEVIGALAVVILAALILDNGLALIPGPPGLG